MFGVYCPAGLYIRKPIHSKYYELMTSSVVDLKCVSGWEKS